MTSKYQTRPRPPKGPSTNGQSTQQRRNVKAATVDDTSDIQIRFGNNYPSNSTSQPASILKKPRANKPDVDRFNDSVAEWRQPEDLDILPIRPMYSPIGTPPRLRTLANSPGIEPYRNTYNLRRLTSPLPSLDDWSTPPMGLETWGIDPLDYRMSQNLHLMRRYPSPLTHFGLPGSGGSSKQKKSYIVVPRLTNLVSPPIGRDEGTFTIPSVRRPAFDALPDPQYSYLERIRSHAPPVARREPSDYLYIRRNEAFANRFIDDFINKTIEDQFIPDLLLEVIAEIDRENKDKSSSTKKPVVDRYFQEINDLVSRKEADHTHLFSDEWIRELDYQRPRIPSSNIDSNFSLLKPLDFREIPPERRPRELRYSDLPSDAQRRVLADLNQELIDFEVQNMVTEITGQTLSEKLRNVPAMSNATNDIYREIESEVIREIAQNAAQDFQLSQRRQVNQVQYDAIEKQAKTQLIDSMLFDELIGKYLHQNGSIVDIDLLSRFLDATILDNLIHQTKTIGEYRTRTLDNYALRKFHANTFMNITMDLLLTELSASLNEDMKDLEEQERRTF